MRDAQSISNTLEISVNEANVENGGNIWPFYVPGDNINLIFFREAQKDYYDLYGNVFTYSKEGVMEYGGNIYEYDKTKKLWVKK